jgi:hypothetical protein
VAVAATRASPLYPEPEFSGVGGEHAHIPIERIDRLSDAMQPQSGRDNTRNDIMKKLALAASMLMLMTVSGQAFAETATSSGRQAVSAASAFDGVVAADTDAVTAYHYHGGPKYND